jgi:hypothetical protein
MPKLVSVVFLRSMEATVARSPLLHLSVTFSKKPIYKPKITTRCANYSLISISLTHTHTLDRKRVYEVSMH